MLTIDILTIFPEVINAYVNESILKRAQEKKKIKITAHDLREFTKDKHKKVDDRPFGGGPGMVMMAQPFFDAIEKLRKKDTKVILLSPAGKVYQQQTAKQLTKEKHLILLCGHYEGIDERVRTKLVDEVYSIGDYVLTGGELPALVVADSITRLIPGVLGDDASAVQESFENNQLDCPHYTRPANFRGIKIPNVLLSGNHLEISKWRESQSQKRTKELRPDLLDKD